MNAFLWYGFNLSALGLWMMAGYYAFEAWRVYALTHKVYYARSWHP